jgi:hypothetical protein
MSEFILATNQKRKALLLGVPDADNLSKLPMVNGDIALVRSALESSNYAIETAGLTPETRLTRTQLLYRVRQFARSAQEGDTLILFYSGHGLHHEGLDYLVPVDGIFDDPDMLPQYLVPIDFPGLFDDCLADTILVIIDACREGINLAVYPDTKSASLHPWSEGRIARSRRKQLTYIYSCRAGEYSRYVEGPDGFSIFTRALANVLGPEHPATTLADIEDALQNQVDLVSKQFGKARQTVRIRSERDAGANQDDRVICEKGASTFTSIRFRGWAEAVDNSPLWELAKDAGTTMIKRSLISRAAAFASVAQQFSIQVTNLDGNSTWIDTDYPTRCLSRIEFMCREVAFRPTLAEVALIVSTVFCHEAIRNAALITSEELLRAHVDRRSTSSKALSAHELAMRGSFRTFVNKYSYFLSGADLPENEDDSPSERRSSASLAMYHHKEWHNALSWIRLKWISSTPEFWSDGPGSFIPNQYWRELFPNSSDTTASTVLDRTLLLQMCRHVAVPPSADYVGSFANLSDIRTHFASTSLEQSIREVLILHLVSLCCRMAIDISSLSDVIGENILGSDSVSPTDVVLTLKKSEWLPIDSDRALQAACTHPALDQALRQHVAGTDRLLQTIHQKALHREDYFDVLERLPNSLVDNGITAAEEIGPSNYLLPHVRLRLSDRKVRDLLMGERLYGQKDLAIRELYQNALDACRYREARIAFLERSGAVSENWRGRIVLRQGTTTEGRRYVECEDNGIGMSHSHLSDCFACAGQRFTEMSEFLDEQAIWLKLKPPIRLTPNSQFGIGVFSYFMLGGEVQISTRRFENSGKLGSELTATVNSSSGLFRVRNESSQREAGTTIRIYLDERADGTALSCRTTLGHLLYVADYDTSVEEDGKVTNWASGELTTQSRALRRRRRFPQFLYREHIEKGEMFLRSSARNLWWSRDHDGQVLADGIRTDKEQPFAVVNLRDLYKPLLSVDRLKIQTYDLEYVNNLLVLGFPDLIQAPWLSFKWLWGFAVSYPSLTDMLVAEMSRRQIALPISLNDYDDDDEAPRYAVGIVGFIPDDENVLEAITEGNGNSKGMPPLLLAHRAELWRKAERLADHPDPMDVSSPEIKTRDWLLFHKRALSARLDERGPWISGDVPVRHVFRAAAQTGVSVGSICDALSQYRETLQITVPHVPDEKIVREPLDQVSVVIVQGLGPQPSFADILRVSLACKASLGSVFRRVLTLSELGVFLIRDRRISGLSADIDLEEADLPLIECLEKCDLYGAGSVTLTEVVAIAAVVGKAVGQTLSRFKLLASIFSLEMDVTAEPYSSLFVPEKGDEILLSRRLNGQRPWIDEVVSIGHVLRASIRVSKPLAEIFQRFEKLEKVIGLSLPKIDLGNIPFDPSNSIDRRLVSLRLDGGPPWLSGTVSAGHVFAAAVATGLQIDRVIERLSEQRDLLGFRFAEGVSEIDVAAQPTSEDIVLISENLDGKHPWLHGRLLLRQIAERAAHLGSKNEDTIKRLERYRVPLQLDLPETSQQIPSGPLDRKMTSVFEGRHLTWRPKINSRRAIETAIRMAISLDEVMQRMAPFSSVVEIDVSNSLQTSVPSDFPNGLDKILLSRKGDGHAPFDWRVTKTKIFLASVARRESPRRIIERLQSIQFDGSVSQPFFDINEFSGNAFSNDELTIASVNGNGASPWLSGIVSGAHLVFVSYRTNRTIESVLDVVRQLSRLLPLRLPDLVGSRLQFVADEIDCILLSMDLDGMPPWIDAPITKRQIDAVVELLGDPSLEINRRLEKLVHCGLV